jgi:ribosome-binding ATPase YchF (GTP1/OBG family)
LEEQLLQFTEDEIKEYLDELKQTWWLEKIPTLDDLIKLSFDTVGLMYFFTSWEKETRAWTIKKWSTAPQAAWVIHSDFEKWFIRAEVVNWKDFVEAWWWANARQKWLVRLEGKDYIVQDGDVMLFRFNV